MVESIYDRAITKWGINSQNDMLIEECAEVIEAVSHYRRGKCSMDDVVGELCDLFIMVQQMRVVYGENRFARILTEKIEALEAKLGGQSDDDTIRNGTGTQATCESTKNRCWM